LFFWVLNYKGSQEYQTKDMLSDLFAKKERERDKNITKK